MVYFVRIPTYAGQWGSEGTHLWEVVEVETGSKLDQEWTRGWTVNDAGEIVPLSYVTIRFETREEALAFIEAAEQH